MIKFVALITSVPHSTIMGANNVNRRRCLGGRGYLAKKARRGRRSKEGG